MALLEKLPQTPQDQNKGSISGRSFATATAFVSSVYLNQMSCVLLSVRVNNCLVSCIINNCQQTILNRMFKLWKLMNKMSSPPSILELLPYFEEVLYETSSYEC